MSIIMGQLLFFILYYCHDSHDKSNFDIYFCDFNIPSVHMWREQPGEDSIKLKNPLYSLSMEFGLVKIFFWVLNRGFMKYLKLALCR